MILGPLQTLELVLAGAVATNELPWTVFVNERDDTTHAIGIEDADHGVTNGTTPVVAVAAPAAGNHRTVRLVVINKDTAAVTLIVQVNYNGTPGELFRVLLDVGDVLNYRDIADWDVKDTHGSLKTGLVGPAGTDGSDGAVTYSSENKEGGTILAGMVCAIHSSGTGVVKASAADNSKAAIGLIQETTANTFAGNVQTEGLFIQADWTDVIGAVTLAAKATYFLDPTTPGMLTVTPPTTPGQIVQIIGTAVSTDTLDLTMETPILL